MAGEREAHTPSSSDGDDDEEQSRNDLRHRQPRPPFGPGTMHQVSLSSSCSPDRRRRKRSSVEKTTAVLKKAMTEKNEKWNSREWYGSTKTRRQLPAESSGRQSSVDAWEHAKPEGKWTEVSADDRVLEALVKEKKIRWTEREKKLKKRSQNVRRAGKQLQMKRERERGKGQGYAW